MIRHEPIQSHLSKILKHVASTCNNAINAIMQCINLINLYGGFPIFASKMRNIHCGDITFQGSVFIMITQFQQHNKFIMYATLNLKIVA